MHPDTLTHLISDIGGNDFTAHDMRREFGTAYGEFANLDLPEITSPLAMPRLERLGAAASTAPNP